MSVCTKCVISFRPAVLNNVYYVLFYFLLFSGLKFCLIMCVVPVISNQYLKSFSNVVLFSSSLKSNYYNAFNSFDSMQLLIQYYLNLADYRFYDSNCFFCSDAASSCVGT